MRRHAKASSAGSKRGKVRLLLVAFAAISAAFALIPALASATKSHFYLEDFGSAEKPTLEEPPALSLAVDQSSGDLLVLSAGYTSGGVGKTIRRFKPDGTPDEFSALGSNVIDGEGPGDGTPEGGLFGLNNENPARSQIAVDNSGTATDGDIYVTGDFERPWVYVFSSSGEYLGKLTQFKEGADASGALTDMGLPCGVAVGPDGAVYVSDKFTGYVHKYVPSANPPISTDNVANFSYPNPCTLAAGAGSTAGSLFVNGEEAALSKLDATTGEVKYAVGPTAVTVSVDPASGDLFAAEEGTSFIHYDASGSSAAVVAKVTVSRPPQGIAVRGSDGNVFLSEFLFPHIRVYSPLLTQADLTIQAADEVSATRARLHGTVNPDGAAVTDCHFEYGTVASGTFSGSVPCEESVPTDANVHSVSALISGLPADGAEYQYRLVATNADGRTATSEAKTFDLPLAVRTGGPALVGPHSALLTGNVRPEGEQITECVFEYGPTTAYGSSAPCSPSAAQIPADFAAHAVEASIEGLEEFSAYHYRLVFSTAGATRTGEDELFRTRGPSGLPDNRRYEQVSPVEKNGSDIAFSKSTASIEGNRIVFTSAGSFAHAPTSFLASRLPYLATRGPSGWSTRSVAMPGGGGFDSLGGYTLLSRDLSWGVIEWPQQSQVGPYDPEAKGNLDAYLADLGNGSFTLANGTLAELGWSGEYGSAPWASADLSRIAISSRAGLTPEAHDLGCHSEFGNFPPTGTPPLGFCAFEWDNGELRYAAIVNGEPVQGVIGARPGVCGYEHAVSDDGGRLFFTSPFPKNGLEPPVGAELYDRENGETTMPISSSERTAPGGLSGQNVFFQNAEAAHGNRVLFTTKNSLVNADTDETNDLYLYDYTKPAGERLTLISADENPNAPEGAAVDGGSYESSEYLGCGGVMGASEDLRRIYFVADNQILAGEPETSGPKLYLWDDTGPSAKASYIGTLDGSSPVLGDFDAWQGPLRRNSLGGETRNARLSRDGRYLTFLSRAQLTGFDNEGRREVYLYDAAAAQEPLVCVSCSADAVPATGAIGFENEGRGAFNHVSTNVTDAGQVFFQTTRGLLPADSNGKMDVYEYENGKLRLISLGEGLSDSFFLDATPSGSDVFFTTKDHLVGWDRDENADAYDARVGGGFPEPPLLAGPCQGDACQSAPVIPNDPTPGTSTFEGAGNVKENASSECRKQKTTQRCAKKKTHHKRKRRHQQHGRQKTSRTNRSHG